MSKQVSTRSEQNAHRAAMLRLLVPLYPEGLTLTGLQDALLIERRPLDDDALKFHLAYLEESGYVKLESSERRGRKKILLAKATRKGVDLHDGRIAEDPGIAL